MKVGLEEGRSGRVRNSPVAWRMLGWLLLVQTTVAFVGRSLAPLSPLLERDLHLSKAQVGMLMASLFLGQSLVSLPGGYWVDRLGSRFLLLVLTLCLGIGFAVAALLKSFGLVLVFIVIGGLGYGAMHTTSNRSIIYWFHPESRGIAMGLKQMGVTIGSSLAALLLLPIALEYGWRITLIFSCFILIIVGLITYWGYRDPFSNDTRVPMEFQSFLTLLWEVARNRQLLAVSLAALGLSSAQMCLTTYVVFFAHEQLGYNIYLAGLLLFVSEIGGSIGRVLWGMISDGLFGGKRLIVLILIALVTSVCSIITSLLPTDAPFEIVLPLIAVFGFSIAGFNGIWMNAATEAVPERWSGLASGFSICIGSWGVIIGPPIFGWIVDWSHNYTTAWLFLSLIMVVVIGLLLWGGFKSDCSSSNKNHLSIF
ncbi:MFS transporter [Geobacillus subterraneus]|uniref:MFS transporter n=1 Tax=Geobacillus subterraneus TaxID=129338 RepID=UPI001442E08B|nr:MFS transporter [Geobacillus subterraneus]QIZ69136.1 MFS transporter [Geobacillus subterraneus]